MGLAHQILVRTRQSKFYDQKQAKIDRWTPPKSVKAGELFKKNFPTAKTWLNLFVINNSKGLMLVLLDRTECNPHCDPNMLHGG